MLLQFMEFTHEFSDHRLVVTDLQGHYDTNTNTYRLTDPVLLSKNRAVFGCTNMLTFTEKTSCLFYSILNFSIVFYWTKRNRQMFENLPRVR